MKKAAKEADSEWSPPTPDPVESGLSAVNFQKDGAKRSRLMVILRDPVFREAHAILKDELEPRGDLAVFLGNETVSAHRYHQFAGMNYLVDGLKRLSKEPVERKILRGKTLTTELPTA